MSNLPLYKIIDLKIAYESNDGSAPSIFMDNENKGKKICININKAREYVFTEVNGKISAFEEIKGHLMCQTKQGSLEMLFTESNTGDRGAV